jgi:hypothetical protein
VLESIKPVHGKVLWINVWRGESERFEENFTDSTDMLARNGEERFWLE